MCYETCPQQRGQRHHEGDREESERASWGGEERWILVFVGQCVTAAAAEEEVEEEEEKEEPTRIVIREASRFMLHHYWFYWSPWEFVAVHLNVLVQTQKHHCACRLHLASSFRLELY